jgi:hypothetical protein
MAKTTHTVAQTCSGMSRTQPVAAMAARLPFLHHAAHIEPSIELAAGYILLDLGDVLLAIVLAAYCRRAS